MLFRKYFVYTNFKNLTKISAADKYGVFSILQYIAYWIIRKKEYTKPFRNYQKNIFF